MNAYETDKEQIEMIKQWWNNYGKTLIIAIVIGLIVGFGWRYWRQHKANESLQASMLYQDMTTAGANNDKKTEALLGEKLIKDFPNTAYASLAAFSLAKEAVNDNKWNVASRQLQWVMQHSDVDSFKQIARLRYSRILLAENKPKMALDTLKTVDDKNYAALIDEVKGDAYVATGNAKSAIKSYQASQLKLLEMGVNNPFLSMKMAQPINHKRQN